MKRAIVPAVAICLALTLAVAGCKNREQAAGDGATETIEPAKPQPDLTGSDAMTQTVDIEKGRGEGEGRNAVGAEITAGATDTTNTTATAATTTVPATSTTTTR